jgi:hypothetical protein
MIRAVVRNGGIQPLEPLPPEWEDGRQVVVADLEDSSADGADDFDKWSEDMRILTAGLNDPQEWRDIEAALAETDRQSKAPQRSARV